MGGKSDRRALLGLARLAGALLTGLLYGLCFAPLHWWPLAGVALVPLLLALRGTRPPFATLLGLTAGTTGTLATMHWLWLPLTHAYGFSVLLAALFLLGLGLYIGLFYALFGAAHALLEARRVPWPGLWIPALWVAGELLRARLGVGVPWLMAGHALGPALPLIQVADLTGVYGPSFLLLAANAAIVLLITGRRWRPLVAVAVSLLPVMEYGLFGRTHWNEGSADKLRVAVVQPAIPQAEKWERSRFAEGMQRLYRLTREALDNKVPEAEQPDLILWPETALTVDLEQAGQTLEPVARLLAPHPTQLLLGATRILPGSDPPEVRNTAALLSGNGILPGRYDKQILLPFGEYRPFWLAWLPWVGRQINERLGGGSFVSGPELPLLSVRGIPFGVAICYEATYPELVGRQVRQGARFVVNLTNDAWFEHSAGAAQHLAMTRFRAVEHRVPLIRAANTGISALVLPSGRVAGTLELDRQGLLQGELVLGPLPPGSAYTRHGDLFAALCLGASALLLLLAATAQLWRTHLSLFRFPAPAPPTRRDR